jgi:TFIIF-interacting CTD phosphatase-like protein
VPLKDILLVDNAVYSFSAQLDNGIPITPFKEDPEDNEFKHLITHLQNCAGADDMR